MWEMVHVYNIVQEWSKEIGQQQADRLREIAIKLKKNGLTVSDCAKGLRMLMMLKKYEIKDDEESRKSHLFFKGNLQQMSRGRIDTSTSF